MPTIADAMANLELYESALETFQIATRSTFSIERLDVLRSDQWDMSGFIEEEFKRIDEYFAAFEPWIELGVWDWYTEY